MVKTQVSTFKAGHYYLRNDGHILNIIGNDARAPFMLVQWLDYGKPFTAPKDFGYFKDFKDLGTNRKAVQVLLGNKE